MWLKEIQFDPQTLVHQHICLLGHDGYGISELRTFDGKPMVAYANNVEGVVRLCYKMDGHVSGIYVGVRPRPLELFDKAPNCWKPALSAPKCNCACDQDIEFITACFFNVDVVSNERMKGYPASEEELQRSYYAAKLLSREEGLALNSTICCSGNGHYVLTPIVPILVDGDEVPLKFRHFCQQLAEKMAGQVSSVKIDPVYNLSRVMRVMGTVNGKGQAVQKRPHRRAHFVTEPIPAKSLALHHMILNTEIASYPRPTGALSGTIRCDLSKIEKCEFIKWCRKYPMKLSEPQWFAMITNLAHLEGGPELIHAISGLDMVRYDYQQTLNLINRVQNRGYSPASCESICKLGFCCQKIELCQAKAPMYLTHLFSIWKR